MSKLRELQEKRAAKFAEAKSIADKGNDVSEMEQTKFAELRNECDMLDKQIVDAKWLDEAERQQNAEPVGGAEMQHEMRNYSLAKATLEGMNGSLSGLEAEVHSELSMGREVRGVMVPTEILLGGQEERALKTTTPGAGPGSNLIATDLASLTDRRRASLKIESMGATVMRGLTGNLDLPRLTGSGTANWVAEHGDASRSDAKFGKTSLSPKTVTAEYEVSRRMLLQSQTALEPLLRNDLSFLLAQQLDSAAIKGGEANEPTGILANNAVQSVAISGDFSDTTADMIAALELDDVTGTRAFLTNPTVMNTARKIKDGDGPVIPVSELFHNERVESSTQVPNDIGAGDDKNALIYGEWASLYLGYWSGIDILMNPYHSDVASKGGALMHAFLDADVVVRHPEGFRYAEMN